MEHHIQYGTNAEPKYDGIGACLWHRSALGKNRSDSKAFGIYRLFAGNDSSKLFFSVQDATALPYAPKTFDAVIISNALHIMPEPQKALSEIKRVLRDDGILIAPTFTAAGSLGGRIKNRIMELSGFKVFHKWTPESYLAFLKSNGFEIQKSEVLSGALTLTYAEARKNN